MITRVRLDRFNPRAGLDRGRPVLTEAAWYGVKRVCFFTGWPWPSTFKCVWLRRFGAQVGRGVVIKPRVNIHLPWKLRIGDHSWLGEEAWILNLEPVTLGAHCCISQRAFLCTGNHDYRQTHFPYRNAPIRIEDGAWVGAQAFVAAGVTIGREGVITAGSIVTRSTPPGMICGGHPCRPLRPRWSEGVIPGSKRIRGSGGGAGPVPTPSASR